MCINVRDNFSNYTVYASFKHTFSISSMVNFSFLVFFGTFCFFCFWGPFAFSVFLFCHPIGGRDSLKKRKIHEEIDFEQICPSPQVSVCSEIGRIPLNPQRPSRARSTEKRRRVKYVIHFFDLNFMIFRISWPLIKKQKI